MSSEVMSAASRLSDAAMDTLDEIRRRYGDSATVGAVIVVCDIIVGEDDEPATNPIFYQSNDPRRWVQEALLHEAVLIAETENEHRHAKADEDGKGDGDGD